MSGSEWCRTCALPAGTCDCLPCPVCDRALRRLIYNGYRCWGGHTVVLGSSRKLWHVVVHDCHEMPEGLTLSAPSRREALDLAGVVCREVMARRVQNRVQSGPGPGPPDPDVWPR